VGLNSHNIRDNNVLICRINSWLNNSSIILPLLAESCTSPFHQLSSKGGKGFHFILLLFSWRNMTASLMSDQICKSSSQLINNLLFNVSKVNNCSAAAIILIPLSCFNSPSSLVTIVSLRCLRQITDLQVFKRTAYIVSNILQFVVDFPPTNKVVEKGAFDLAISYLSSLMAAAFVSDIVRVN
jgi:hypothetical protein